MPPKYPTLINELLNSGVMFKIFLNARPSSAKKFFANIIKRSGIANYPSQICFIENY